MTSCATGPPVPNLLFQPVMMPSSEAKRKVALVLLGAGRRKPVAEPVDAAPLGWPVAVVPPVAAGMEILNAIAGVAGGGNEGEVGGGGAGVRAGGWGGCRK